MMGAGGEGVVKLNVVDEAPAVEEASIVEVGDEWGGSGLEL